MAAAVADIYDNARREHACSWRIHNDEASGRICHSRADVRRVRPISSHKKILDPKCRVDDSHELRNVFFGRVARYSIPVISHLMLGEKLLERILERLGLPTLPHPEHDGLSAIYAAWCTSVPFDNIAKLIALRSGSAGALPGLDATEFFDRLLEHGIGGTCWPSSNALFELLVSSGFNARRIAGSMRDTGIVSHASIKVSLGGIDWLVDSSMLTAAPIPLTDEIHIPDDKLFGAEVEFVDGTHIVWANLPPNPSLIPCRMLVDPATPEYCAERYEASRLRSPFNERLYAKRNTADGQLVLMANLRISRTATGTETRELTKAELCESLRDEMGVSGAMIEEWRTSGALEASFRPSSAPPQAAVTTLPPSLRFILPR